jgi:hypothetical protein
MSFTGTDALVAELRRVAEGPFNRLSALAPSEVGNDPCGCGVRCRFLSPTSFGQAKEIGSPSREKRLVQTLYNKAC